MVGEPADAVAEPLLLRRRRRGRGRPARPGPARSKRLSADLRDRGPPPRSPRSFARSSARARFTTRATGQVLERPGAGPRRPRRRGAARGAPVTSAPVAPAASAARSTAPTFCGSSTPSRATRRRRPPGRGARSSSSETSGSGPGLEHAAPWVRAPGARRFERVRGQPPPRGPPPPGPASRSSASSGRRSPSRTRAGAARRRRARSASRTGWKPTMGARVHGRGVWRPHRASLGALPGGAALHSRATGRDLARPSSGAPPLGGWRGPRAGRPGPGPAGGS